jgi:hypothetical protein
MLWRLDFSTTKIGTVLDLQEESRYGTSIDYQNVEKHIIKDVTLLLSKIADKSDRLINNSTTNLAESWMHIIGFLNTWLT